MKQRDPEQAGGYAKRVRTRSHKRKQRDVYEIASHPPSMPMHLTQTPKEYFRICLNCGASRSTAAMYSLRVPELGLIHYCRKCPE